MVDRTSEMLKNDVVKYGRVTIQCKDFGRIRKLEGTLSRELFFGRGKLILNRTFDPDQTYLPVDVFEEQNETLEEENEEEEEIPTQPCWHPEQAKCPWDAVPFKDRPLNDKPFSKKDKK